MLFRFMQRFEAVFRGNDVVIFVGELYFEQLDVRGNVVNNQDKCGHLNTDFGFVKKAAHGTEKICD